MPHTDLQKTVEAAWDKRDGVNAATKGEVRTAVDTALSLLDNGELRACEKRDGDSVGRSGASPDATWIVNQWAKKAVLLSFRLNDNWNHIVSRDTGYSVGWDKVQLKFADWGDKEFKAAGFRAVPGATCSRPLSSRPASASTTPRPGCTSGAPATSLAGTPWRRWRRSGCWPRRGPSTARTGRGTCGWRSPRRTSGSPLPPSAWPRCPADPLPRCPADPLTRC